MSNSIEEVLSHFLYSQELADVKFIVGKNKKVFYAHKLVLSIVSSFWEKQFYSENWECDDRLGVSEIVVDDIECETFAHFLEYAYKKEIELSAGMITKIYFVAEKYEMDDLRQYCISEFKRSLDETNYIAYYEFGKQIGVEEYTEYAKRYIENNSDLIFENRDCFKSLSVDTIKMVLGLKKLMAKEIDIFQALVGWAKEKKATEYKDNEGVTLKTLLQDFLPNIRLDLMDFKDLKIVKETGLFPVQQLFNHSINLIQKYKIKICPLTRAGPQLEHLKVLLLAAARRGQSRLDHLQDTIKSNGIQYVTIINLSSATPTFEFINQYDVVVLRGRNGAGMINPNILGDHLARFVEGGKGLVVIAINTLINSDNYRIKGRIVDDEFIPLAIGERIHESSRNLGDVLIPEHPIMEDVESFKTKEYAHLIGTQNINGGKLIAKWTNGYPLITEKNKKEGFGTVVCLNFHPMSTKITDDCGKAWLHDTDGDKIISNSVAYVGMRYYNYFY
ncbi:btb (poz) domain-containing 2a-related [Anaeramoeba flamelloides]|uniref:Btb (Poz) domain-containing 2a-related n=1 Tax=Anaeramoeba flamelloides TaxID=1746091 RepID=A0AAV7ZS46_9EUKA|nr:btb (poz) domain-containing 2a-related [Anaeramoeba flamelloides]KAJ6252424.1 btb (poz) domain-containing 2a-related [Anaeramoeba flamelloides]